MISPLPLTRRLFLVLAGLTLTAPLSPARADVPSEGEGTPSVTADTAEAYGAYLAKLDEYVGLYGAPS